MKKVIITKGLPGSGKSTWAKELQQSNPGAYKRVNKDDLRNMLDNGQWSKHNESFVLKVRDFIIEQALEDGKHVIVDDTNLHPKHYEKVTEIAQGKALVEIQDFTHVTPEECIERDLKRPDSVGQKVIWGMYNQFLKPEQEKVVLKQDKTLPKAIIVDIDGTLASMKDRGPFEWHKVKTDVCNEDIRGIVNNYYSMGYKIIIMTGRDGVCREDTLKWLKQYGIKHDLFLMREEGNNEKDDGLKERLFNENVAGKYYVEFVLDDRNQVVDMWRKMGLRCFQVAPGDF